MTVQLHCPACATIVCVPADAAGQVWGCGQCGQQFQVPVLPSQPAALPVSEPDPLFDVVPEPPEPEPDNPATRRDKRRQQAAAANRGILIWWIIIPSALSLTILTCVYLYMLNRQPARKPQPGKRTEWRQNTVYGNRPDKPPHPAPRKEQRS